MPLATAQQMFHSPGRLTAIAIRLKDPSKIGSVAARLQNIPGAQTVTMTEMMGTFLNLSNAARTLVGAVAIVALLIAGLGIFNTMMAATIERTRELAVLRAVGITRGATFSLMAIESLMLCAAGGVFGLAMAEALGQAAYHCVVSFLPLAPDSPLPSLTAHAALVCMETMLAVGIVAGLYPAWQASRLQPSQALRMD